MNWPQAWAIARVYLADRPGLLGIVDGSPWQLSSPPRFELRAGPVYASPDAGSNANGAKRARLQAALISMILNFILPRGAATSTVSPFFLPMIAFPTGDSLESLFSAGFASAEPTM